MGSLSVFLRGLLDDAEANGWDILEFDGSEFGHVTLVDKYANEIRITSRIGIDTPAYVKSIHAIKRENDDRVRG